MVGRSTGGTKRPYGFSYPLTPTYWHQCVRSERLLDDFHLAGNLAIDIQAARLFRGDEGFHHAQEGHMLNAHALLLHDPGDHSKSVFSESISIPPHLLPFIEFRFGEDPTVLLARLRNIR